jgi:putative beta-barrel porin MtrB/PioB
VELLQPIEQTIHDFRLRGSWATPRWQLQFSYVLSIFENDLDKVQFDNPCFGNPLCSAGNRTGPKFGTTSLPPDNIAHTLSLAGGVNLPLRTRINANFSYSWRLQNADFLPQTTTNTLPLTHPELGLPQKSLHGDVQIALFNLTATSRPLPIPVTFTAKYRLYDMMDHSDHPSFSAFLIDDVTSIASGPQEADRFDFRKQNADFDARWQIIQSAALTLGAAWERWERSFDFEVPKSDEFFAKAALDFTPTDWLMVRATYLPSFRRIDRYCVDCLPQGEENAEPGELGQSFLLRKFNEADRNRHRADLMVQITPNDRLSITPVASYKYDDYIASGLTHDATAVAPAGCPVASCSFNGTNMLGLQQVTSWSAGMDVNWKPLDWISFAAGYMREYNFQKMRSRARTTAVDVPDLDWVSNNIDTTDTYHASLTAKLIPGTLDLKLSGNYEYALGQIQTYNPNAPGSAIYNSFNSTNSVARPFPAFEDSLLRLDAALRYHFLKNWTASLYYAFETFRKHDWRTDALNPFFLNQSCTAAGCPVDAVWLGNDPRNYEAHIVGLTLAYRFK